MTFYLSGVGVYGIFLIYKMFGDPECSKTDPTSWMVITVASLFWLIVIPISLLELRAKFQAKQQIETIVEFGELISDRYHY